MNPPPDPDTVRSLLIRANNWIGDVVLASPALHALRVRFPAARIAVLARPAVVPALEGSPDIDEIIVLPRDQGPRSPLGKLAIIRELRSRQFDLAVLFQKSVGAAILARASGAKRRYGYDTDHRAFLLTDPLQETPEVRARHHARVFLDLAASAGAAAGDSPWDLELRFPLKDEDRAGASRCLEAAGIAKSTPIVAIHPGASKLPRAWHPERFGLAARTVARKIGGMAVVVGTARESALAARVQAAASSAVFDLSGRTTLREMAAIFERSRLFIGSDSGPMHIAAAVGTPIVAVFGPGTPEKTAPFVSPERYEIVTLRFSCSPCRQDFFRECTAAPSGKPYCIDGITVEQVEAAADRLLARV